jgi:hypothetical protein
LRVHVSRVCVAWLFDLIFTVYWLKFTSNVCDNWSTHWSLRVHVSRVYVTWLFDLIFTVYWLKFTSSFCDNWSTQWSLREVHVSRVCVTWLFNLIFMVYWLKKCKVFVIRSISLLTYNLGLPYLVHTFDHGGYMSTRCLSSDSDLIYRVYWLFF